MQHSYLYTLKLSSSKVEIPLGERGKLGRVNLRHVTVGPIGKFSWDCISTWPQPSTILSDLD